MGGRWRGQHNGKRQKERREIKTEKDKNDAQGRERSILRGGERETERKNMVESEIKIRKYQKSGNVCYVDKMVKHDQMSGNSFAKQSVTNNYNEITMLNCAVIFGKWYDFQQSVMWFLRNSSKPM